MKRAVVLSSLLAISVIFMFLQIYFLSFHNRSNGRDHTELTAEIRHHEKSMASPNNVIKLFVNITAAHNVPVFLIDPSILQTIVNYQKSGTKTVGKCKYLCHSRLVTTFAILHNHWNPQTQFLVTLKKNGFTWTHTTGQDPRLLSVPSMNAIDVSLHYLFINSHHVIHLVIFFERNDNYWWHGPITLQDTFDSHIETIGLNLSAVLIGQHAGAYDKMEIMQFKADGLKINVPRYPTLFLEQVPHSQFIECNYARAKEFLDKNGDDNSADAVHFRVKAKNLLSKAKELLDQIGIQFWLSSGTCLGWFRECNTISHSKDVDIGIWIKDYDVRLIPALQMSGLHLKHIFGKREDSFELSFLADDIKLDIFFFYEEGNTMWNGGTQVKSAKKFKYVFPRFTLCWTEFLGMKVRVPCQSQAYIEANYGKDWNTRVMEWDWKKNPPNVQENGYWDSNEWSQVMQIFG
ncbi:ribitol-5-phosphate transferase FKTN-like [Saccoglossus kowalevskii]|uniref:Fukutin-like n=1 Tax=Saccoglossus kowalevskii TaxID=10224 RepID=A0ABM0N1A7_SACKO|nr:PREDICTED: fukutin-like [Saccoglossus kowalevskii]